MELREELTPKQAARKIQRQDAIIGLLWTKLQQEYRYANRNHRWEDIESCWETKKALIEAEIKEIK